MRSPSNFESAITLLASYCYSFCLCLEPSSRWTKIEYLRRMGHSTSYELQLKIMKIRFHTFLSTNLMCHCTWVLAPADCSLHIFRKRGPSYKFPSTENSITVYQFSYLRRNHRVYLMNWMRYLMFRYHYHTLLELLVFLFCCFRVSALWFVLAPKYWIEFTLPLCLVLIWVKRAG